MRFTKPNALNGKTKVLKFLTSINRAWHDSIIQKTKLRSINTFTLPTATDNPSLSKALQFILHPPPTPTVQNKQKAAASQPLLLFASPFVYRPA